LHLKQPLDAAAREAGEDPSAFRERWERIRQTLREAREERPRPGLDDKVLTDWNGLLIAALSKAARALPDGEKYEQSAVSAARFLRDTMIQQDGDDVRLLHRYRNGDTAIRGHLDDYVYLAWGLTELYETTFDAEWLSVAVDLTDAMIEHFEDSDHGGFFFTADDAEALIVRQKEFYDGAMPSGNSAAMTLLIRLSRLTGEVRYEEAAGRLRDVAGEQVTGQPAGFTGFLVGLYMALCPSREIVLAGDRDDPALREMVDAIRARYLPATVVLHRPPGDAKQITEIAPFTREQTPVDGTPAAYVCYDFACQKPVTTAGELEL
jgi:hypothetical protein